jgi:transcriptional regulator with XRE-family HTH domain
VSRRRHIFKSEGRVALLAALSRGMTQSALAKKIHFSQSEISFWASGQRVPQYEARAALARELGIGLDTWDREAPPNIAPAIADRSTIVSVDATPLGEPAAPATSPPNRAA